MANKQFRMEKNREHQCALISHTMLKKTNMFNFIGKSDSTYFFWMKILVFVGFWIKFGSEKQFFGLTLKKMFFESNI